MRQFVLAISIFCIASLAIAGPTIAVKTKAGREIKAETLRFSGGSFSFKSHGIVVNLPAADVASVTVASGADDAAKAAKAGQKVKELEAKVQQQAQEIEKSAKRINLLEQEVQGLKDALVKLSVAAAQQKPAPTPTPAVQKPRNPNNYLGQANYPYVVELDPPNNAKDVDPGRKQITVTYNRAMRGGYSWVNKGQCPKIERIEWINNNRQCRAYVTLEPNREYAVWLNYGRNTSKFRGQEGISADRVYWQFRTSSAKAAP